MNRVFVNIAGSVDGSRRAGFLTLAEGLIRCGLDDIVVSVESASSIHAQGALALLELLQHLRSGGAATYLAVGRTGIAALQAAAHASSDCCPLATSVARWMDLAG